MCPFQRGFYCVLYSECPITVEPLIKDTPNKGNLSIKDKSPCPNVSFIRRFHCIGGSTVFPMSVVSWQTPH